jgi:hypothetical protein
MIEGVYRSLRSGGRFVAECGGHGCTSKIRIALVQALDRRGVDGVTCALVFSNARRLRNSPGTAGFRVNSSALIPRPTPLPGDVIAYLETFGKSFLARTIRVWGKYSPGRPIGQGRNRWGL